MLSERVPFVFVTVPHQKMTACIDSDVLALSIEDVA